MGTTGRFFRGRIRALAALSAVVSVVAGLLVVGVGAGPAKADPGCPTYQVFGARGSGDPSNGFQGMGPKVGVFAQAAASVLPGAGVTTDYTNVPYEAVSLNDPAEYPNSVNGGIQMLASEIDGTVSRCPGVRIGLIGYSQGAEVVHDAILAGGLSLDDIHHIASVLILADPVGETGPVSTDELMDVVTPTPSGSAGTHNGGGVLDRHPLPLSVALNTINMCIQGDPICDASSTDMLTNLQNLSPAGMAIHSSYAQCCGSLNYPYILGVQFADNLMLPSYTPPPVGGGSSGGSGGGGNPPPLVTSVYGLADGTVLVTQDTGRVYKMVGGAPVWLSSCANNLCPNPLPTTQAVINAGPAYPRDGATATEDANIFKFVGGAPIHLASCSVGCGSPVRITAWSFVHFEHMRATPADGSTVVDEPGDIFKFVGGAPIHLASCAEGCGNPVHITGWSVAAFDHMNGIPDDGESVVDESGEVFKFVGGAPIHLASCALGCGPMIGITSASIATYHMNQVPEDGSTMIDEAGDIFKFAGGAPIHLASCQMGCGTPVGITGASIVQLDHMRAMPADGTTVVDEPGDVFKFAGGAPIHLISCAMGCGSPVWITGASIIQLDHMRLTPADNTTIQTETTAIYKFAGGTPLPLSSCDAGCGAPVGIPQASVDARDHMNTAPADGANVVTVEDGVHYQAAFGELDLAEDCGTVDCSAAVRVNQFSITPFAQSTANRGPGFGELARYSNGSDHLSAVGAVPVGYRFEAPLGLLGRTAASGSVPLMACQAGADTFSSLDQACEGQKVLGPLGFIFTAPPAGEPSAPLYRCKQTTGGEHFDSNDPKCEGQTVEAQLGYTIAYGTLTRYTNGTDHWTSTLGLPAGYQAESTFGMLPLTQQPGTQPLFSCKSGNGDEFTSLDSNCEGQSKLAQLGFIWTSQPSGLPTTRIYRCRISPTGEHFDSGDPNCEGKTVDGPLGYVLARTVLSRTARIDGQHRSTSGGGLPAGFRLEGTLGYLSWIAEPGTQVLFSCQQNGSQFDSLDPSCEGQMRLSELGYIWQQPPAGTPSAQIFRCATTTSHFDSTDPNCEGQRVEGPLGYLEEQL